MAPAVSNTLKATTNGVPIFATSLFVRSADAIVQTEIISVITPAHETDASRSECITGQAEPSKESGNPKLIKAR